MSEIEEVFRVLLFGEGFWLGFLIIISICLIMANKIKYSGIIFTIALFFLALEYNENIETSSNKMWGMIMCFIGVVFLIIQTAWDIKED